MVLKLYSLIILIRNNCNITRNTSRETSNINVGPTRDHIPFAALMGKFAGHSQSVVKYNDAQQELAL